MLHCLQAIALANVLLHSCSMLAGAGAADRSAAPLVDMANVLMNTTARQLAASAEKPDEVDKTLDQVKMALLVDRHVLNTPLSTPLTFAPRVWGQHNRA